MQCFNPDCLCQTPKKGQLFARVPNPEDKTKTVVLPIHMIYHPGVRDHKQRLVDQGPHIVVARKVEGGISYDQYPVGVATWAF